MHEFLSKYGTQLITGIIAISGILLGLFWNQFFAWRRNKREQKAKLNNLLFHLLELYFFVNRGDVTSYMKSYIAEMENRFGVVPKEELEQVMQVIIPLMKEKLSALKDQEDIERLSGHYEAAVKEIAYINPFLAYRLAGQSKKFNKLELLDDYFGAFDELMSTEEEKEFFNGVISNFNEEKLLKEMIGDLKDSVLEVSKTIGMSKHLEAKKYFLDQEKMMKEEMQKEIKIIVDEIEKQTSKVVSMPLN